MLVPSHAAAKKGKTVFSEKGPEGRVSVIKSDRGDSYKLVIDGELAGWSGDGTVRRGHYPLILSPSASRVLVIGMGTGSQIAAALDHNPLIVDVVEASPQEIKAATFFTKDNRGALSDKRVNMINESPLKWVEKAEGRYDIIMTGFDSRNILSQADEITLENFVNLGKLLAPGGVVARWVDLSGLSKKESRVIAATFDKAFPHVTIWGGDINSPRSWIMFLGSKEPFRFDPEAIHKKLLSISVTGDMAEGGNAYSFLSFYITSENSLKELVSNVGIHSTENPALGKKDKKADPVKRSVENFIFWSGYRSPITTVIKTADAVAEKLDSYFRARSKIIRGRNIGVAGRTKVELEWYDKAYDEAPEDPHLALSYLAIGRAYYKSGLYPQAAILLEKAKKISPDQPVIRFYLGKTYEKTMRYPEAEEEFKKLKELSPGYYEKPHLAPKGARPIS